MLNELKLRESVLDQPHTDLCEDIWIKDEHTNTYYMTEEAKSKIGHVVNYVTDRFGLINVSVNITGSITSNSYSDDSDIDIHIHSPLINDENADDMNKKLRLDFEENIKDSFNGNDKIKSHPLEVYFQVNPIQDLMSVGCYDFKEHKWIVGPELKPISYDPFADYYDDDMNYAEEIVKDIRNIILEVNELIIVINSSKEKDFKNKRLTELILKLKDAADIFDSMRKMRTAYSSPKTKEEALKNRSSRKWKIADSSFKLMDKYGYLPILKSFKTTYNDIKNNPNAIIPLLSNISNEISTILNQN